jgi:hypothetical protein
MVTQLARFAGAYVIGTGRAADRQKALDYGANEFVDLDNEVLEDIGQVDMAFDLIGGDIGKKSARLVRAGGTLVSSVEPSEERPEPAWRSTSFWSPIVFNWMKSCSGYGTDDCGRTSASSRPSTMPSPRSTRLSDVRGRRSSAFVREDSGCTAHTSRQSRRGRLDSARGLEDFSPREPGRKAAFNENWKAVM